MATRAEEYLAPEWQKKRLRILERDNWTCLICGDTKDTLHVHHKDYIKGNKIWEYEDEWLETLCDKCHLIEHKYDKFFPGEYVIHRIKYTNIDNKVKMLVYGHDDQIDNFIRILEFSNDNKEIYSDYKIQWQLIEMIQSKIDSYAALFSSLLNPETNGK